MSSGWALTGPAVGVTSSPVSPAAENSYRTVMHTHNPGCEQQQHLLKAACDCRLLVWSASSGTAVAAGVLCATLQLR
jgi:hypothetical protein